MISQHEKRGGAAIGLLADLDGIAGAAVVYLRMWCDGATAQRDLHSDFVSALGTEQGGKATGSLQQLCDLCARYGRRPLMRHSRQCKCIGSDEACFANFIATAVEGEREDAMLIATLFVRPDVAPLVASLATEFGLALKRMSVSGPARTAHHQNVQPLLH